MKKIVVAVATLLATSVAISAQQRTDDSIRVINLQEVQVVSYRATPRTPVIHIEVTKEEIKAQNFGLDIPFLLTLTPSVLNTSDAGSGVGYTSIRVRGTDATRINITANGIPMNDAESHNIYWVNIPDFASSLEDIQIQRGAGTSANGSGAFGGSINMRTQNIPTQAQAEVSGSYGSFNTHKEMVKVSSGLINSRWGFDARLSNIQSDGYRDRATSDLKSYFVQGGYYGDYTTLKFITFGGKEKTYHAWDGINREQLENDRTYNPNGKISEGVYYDDQTDNYRQTHYQLLFSHVFSPMWNLNIALHYTDGFGYYQEYKSEQKLKKYGLTPYEVDGTAVERSNLVRQKLVDSGFGGGVFSINYKNKRLDASLGGAMSYYSNDHYGKVIWTENYIGALSPDHEYYRNTGTKLDGNLYAKANYTLVKGLSAYVDLQYRYIRYKIEGNNDKWDSTVNPERLQKLDIDEPFNFFNPKVGLFWKINPYNSAYASFSVAQKEPTRNNYTDGFFTRLPRSEKLLDYEFGYTFSNSRYMAGANLYYMNYIDQLIPNGQLNEIGEPVAENVKDSYRMGIELFAGVELTDWLRWDINGTWSKNRIKNYVGYVPNANGEPQRIEVGNTPISFSPSLMLKSNIGFKFKEFSASFQSQYVSRQYLDNFGMERSSLDPYFVNHLHLSYSFKLHHTKEITVGTTIYNLFNTMYETNGYAQTQIDVKDGIAHFSFDPRFYPMAGTNVLAHATVRF